MSIITKPAPLRPDYWQEPDQSALADIIWNIPERPSGKLLITGGNLQNFAAIIRFAEQLHSKQNFTTTEILFPDAIKPHLASSVPAAFAPSTPSGSFSSSHELAAALESADLNLIFGDLSKNSATSIALTAALQTVASPTLLTRDSIETLATGAAELLSNPNFIFLASLAQLQKLLRVIYYPKMLLLSMPLLPALEILHKFTLTYPATIITFHQNQLIFARSGLVYTVNISATPYSPLTIWSGNFAIKTLLATFHNQSNPLLAAVAALSL